MNVSYRDLKVWQFSMKQVLSVYRVTRLFPKEELYGLVSQMRRAAVSIPSNIAEGKGRLTDRDRAHFYLIARELNYMSHADSERLLRSSDEIGRMLNGLIQAIRSAKTSLRELTSRA